MAMCTRCELLLVGRHSGSCLQVRVGAVTSSSRSKPSKRRRSELRRGRSRWRKRDLSTGGVERVLDLLLDISFLRCHHGDMARKEVPDDLDRYIAERARKSPKLPAMVAARTSRRVLQRQLAERRVAMGMTQTEAAVLMSTSQSSIARLESGEHDVRVSTLERYALILGCSVTMRLEEAS